MNKPVLLIDMDEVLCDFYNHPIFPFVRRKHDRAYMNRMMRGLDFWTGLQPIKGSLGAVKELLKSGRFDIYICTKPVKESAECYKGKMLWIDKYLPELVGKIIMCQDKGMVLGDYLIDDNLINKHGFKGRFLHFDRSVASEKVWSSILKTLLKGDIYDTSSTRR